MIDLPDNQLLIMIQPKKHYFLVIKIPGWNKKKTRILTYQLDAMNVQKCVKFEGVISLINLNKNRVLLYLNGNQQYKKA